MWLEWALQRWCYVNSDDSPIFTQPLSVISRLDTFRSLITRLKRIMKQRPEEAELYSHTLLALYHCGKPVDFHSCLMHCQVLLQRVHEIWHGLCDKSFFYICYYTFCTWKYYLLHLSCPIPRVSYSATCLSSFTYLNPLIMTVQGSCLNVPLPPATLIT